MNTEEVEYDSLMGEEVPAQPRVVEKRRYPEMREDFMNVAKKDHYLKVESEVLCEEKPSNTERLSHDAEEIYKNTKRREFLYQQILQKIRWRMNEKGKPESNAKLVKWSDGSYGIYIGDKYYELDGSSTGNSLVFSGENDHMVSVAQLGFTSTLKSAYPMNPL